MTSTTISGIDAWEVLDSRGNPTVACEVRLEGGARAWAAVPSGASAGAHEAHELRDGGERYGGKGVLGAVGNVLQLLSGVAIGRDARDQSGLDAALRAADGTAKLSRAGANAVLALSVAALRAAAEAEGEPLYRWIAKGSRPLLPMPMINIISGGAHAGGAVDVQDFLVVPLGAESFAQALEWAVRVRRATASVAEDRGLSTALIADEGGLAFPLKSNREALELLSAGIERSGLRAGEDAGIAIDVAASQFLDGGVYRFAAEQRELSAAALVDELASWVCEHAVISIEDALGEDDWAGWKSATERLGGIQLLGDDLFVTDLERLDRGIREGVANAVLVKPNQTGTISDAAAVVKRAQAAGYAPVVSARSGETEDSWIADLAVGWGAGQIKIGSTMRSERTAKWNRLLRIEHELQDGADFAGRSAFTRHDKKDG